MGGPPPPAAPTPPARPSVQPIAAPQPTGAPKTAPPPPAHPPAAPTAETPASSGRRTFWAARNRTGTIIEMATVDLDSKRVAFWSKHDIPVRGDVSTDLKPGLYRVIVDREQRGLRWPADSAPTQFSVKLTGVKSPFDLNFPPAFYVIAHRGFAAAGPNSFAGTKQRVIDAVSSNRFADAYQCLDELDELGLHEVADEIWIDRASIIVELLRNFQKGVDAKSFDMKRILRAVESYSVESQRRLYVDAFLQAGVHPSTWKRDPEREAAGLSLVKLAFTYNTTPQRAILVYADDIKSAPDVGSEPPSYGIGELFYPWQMNAATTPNMVAAKKQVIEEIERGNIEFFKKAWQAVELTINLVLAANTLTAAVTSAVAAAPRAAAPVSAAVAFERKMGTWLAEFDTMNDADALYQMRAANAPGRGIGFYRGAVQFDGRDLTTRTLLEAKNWADGGKMSTALTQGRYWAGNSVLSQGLRQVAAAGEFGVQWRVSGRVAADIIQQIFRNNKVPIEVVFFP